MNLTGKSFLGGEPVSCLGVTFRAINPADLSPMEPFFEEATPSAVERALELAESCMGALAKQSPGNRARLLDVIAEQIQRLGDDLLTRAHAETGLPLERLGGERTRTINQLRLFASLLREGAWVDSRIDTALPERQPLPRPDLRRMLVPIGPVVVFGASNFPLAFSVAGGDTASALAAGCPVIVKAHPAHPGTCELIARAINAAVLECDFPAGVFSMLHGGPEIGRALVKHPLTKAIGFTGSRRVGMALFAVAQNRGEPVPFFGELSSLNPVFVLPDALRTRTEALAEGIKNSALMGVGQFCTKPGVLIAVGGPAFQKFEQRIRELFAEQSLGTMLSGGIQSNFQGGLRRTGRVEGVELLVNPEEKGAQEKSASAYPSLMKTSAANFLRRQELWEEVFGPHLLLVEAEDYAQLLAVATQINGQLTATIHATPDEVRDVRPLASALVHKAGRIVYNGYPTGVEVCHAMQHGGPFPASTDSRFTSVGTAAIQRWVRPVCFQNFPDALLPEELQEANPRHITRLVNGRFEL
jgi:NADP-dependent aldehyde dehydrogenase